MGQHSWRSLEIVDEASEPKRLMNAGPCRTESIDLSSLFVQDVSASGSFDFRSLEETSFGRLLMSLPVPAFLVDSFCQVTFCNEAWQRLGISLNEIQGKSFLAFLENEKAAQAYETFIGSLFTDRKPRQKEENLLIRDKLVPARIYYRPIRLLERRVVLGLVEDLSQQRSQLLLMKRIEQAKLHWERTFDAVPDLIAITDPQRRIVRLNKAAADRIGTSYAEALGQPCYTLFHGMSEPPAFCPCLTTISEGVQTATGYFDGNLSGYFEETISPIKNVRGNVLGSVLVCRDVSNGKVLEDALRYHATHDDLTGVFNRRQVMDLLEAACRTSARYHHPLSACICDLDNFKSVNDRYGHLAGDELLVMFVDAVKHELRASDMVGRYGGDEFILVFPETPMSGAVESLERVRRRLAQTLADSEWHDTGVTCSAGVAEWTATCTTASDLVRDADHALLAAKQAGRDRVMTSVSQAGAS